MVMRKSVIVAGLAALALALRLPASVDPTTLDLSVKPQDDFYRYANGAWLRSNMIPPEYTS